MAQILARTPRPQRPTTDDDLPLETERAEGPRAPSTPGELLRAARLRRRISLAEAERATRIRQRYLEALEDDDHGVLPPGVYSRGFLRNYAIYLGVPPEDVVGSVEPRARRDRRVSVRTIARPIRIRVSRTTWVISALGVVLLVLAALVALALTSPTDTAATRRAAAPAPAVSPTALVTLPPLAPAATATSAPTPIPAAAPTSTISSSRGAVDVELKTTDRTWIRATVDGKVVLEDILAAGQSRRWTGQQSVLLRVGNAGGVDVTVNGQHVGTLGPAQQPADREFTR